MEYWILCRDVDSPRNGVVMPLLMLGKGYFTPIGYIIMVVGWLIGDENTMSVGAALGGLGVTRKAVAGL